MTRICYGLPPVQEIDSHLLAEIRELPRIPRKVIKNLINGKSINLYDGEFKLGTGHVRYFYDKLQYLHERYNELYSECISRNFSIKYDANLFIVSDGGLENRFLEKYYNNVYPKPKHTQLVKERIASNIRKSTQIPRYYGKPIDKEKYITEILKIDEYETTLH